MQNETLLLLKIVYLNCVVFCFTIFYKNLMIFFGGGGGIVNSYGDLRDFGKTWVCVSFCVFHVWLIVSNASFCWLLTTPLLTDCWRCSSGKFLTTPLLPYFWQRPLCKISEDAPSGRYLTTSVPPEPPSLQCARCSLQRCSYYAEQSPYILGIHCIHCILWLLYLSR